MQILCKHPGYNYHPVLFSKRTTISPKSPTAKGEDLKGTAEQGKTGEVKDNKTQKNTGINPAATDKKTGGRPEKDDS